MEHRCTSKKNSARQRMHVAGSSLVLKTLDRSDRHCGFLEVTLEQISQFIHAVLSFSYS